MTAGSGSATEKDMIFRGAGKLLGGKLGFINRIG